MMSDERTAISHATSEISKRIFDFYSNKRYSKIYDPLQIFINKLVSSNKSDLQIEELNFIADLCVKALNKMLKQKKTHEKFLHITSKLIKNYSNSALISRINMINIAHSHLIDGKFEEAKKAAKTALKLSESSSECSELVPKLYLLLSEIYLKIPGKYDKSLVNSQKALDICSRKYNLAKHPKIFKVHIESLISKCLYYIQVMDTEQASSMIKKINDFIGKKKLCKHLNDKFQRLEKDVNSLMTFKNNDKKRSKAYKTSESLEFDIENHVSRHKSKMVFLNKSMDAQVNHNFLNEFYAAIRIQTYFRMWVQRRKFLMIINRSVLKHIKRKINNIDYIITAVLNKNKDIIIEASPLISGIQIPKSYIIEKNKHKEFGIENFNFISSLLGWVSIINNRIFVSHKLNKKRLVYKTNSNLQSEEKYMVKIFETEDEIIVQAANDNLYELVLIRNTVPMNMQICPSLILLKTKIQDDKLIFV